MASEVVLPQWGMEMQDGVIVRWLKQEGDAVQEGEPLVEIETSKMQTELESTVSGVLDRIVAQEGEIVPIRGVLCIIADPGEVTERPVAAASAPPATVGAGVSAAAPTAIAGGAPGLRAPVVPAARRLARDNNVDLAQVRGSGPQGRILLQDVENAVRAKTEAPVETEAGGRVPVVPAARRLAREHGIDLALVKGSGPQGRVLIEDVEAFIDAQSQPEAGPDAATGDGVIPLRGIRGAIATRMLQSLQTMAQVTLTTEADVTDAMTLRRGLSQHQSGGSISPLHLVIKATAEGLKQHPRMNAIQAEDHVRLMDEINIGVAVALDEGLVTPVVRDAGAKSLGQLSVEGRDLAARTREGGIRPEEISGGTFTVTNLGPNDIDGFTPIINPPQVGILGVGRVVEKPVIRDGQITKGSTMYLSLTFDHRVVDGAPAAEFLQTVKRLLEDPWWMVS